MKKIATLLVGILVLTSCDQDFQRKDTTNTNRTTQDRNDQDLPANPTTPPTVPQNPNR